MQRRDFLLATTASAWALSAQAHHGWSSFDQNRPIYLEGRAASVAWRNPHAELMLELPAEPKLPSDLATRTVPAQTAPVNGAALMKAAQLPRRSDKRWEVELAPLTRMNAWGVPQIKDGDALAVLGFTFIEEKGDAILRAEYLFFEGKVYGMRSSPA